MEPRRVGPKGCGPKGCGPKGCGPKGCPKGEGPKNGGHHLQPNQQQQPQAAGAAAAEREKSRDGGKQRQSSPRKSQNHPRDEASQTSEQPFETLDPLGKLCTCNVMIFKKIFASTTSRGFSFDSKHMFHRTFLLEKNRVLTALLKKRITNAWGQGLTASVAQIGKRPGTNCQLHLLQPTMSLQGSIQNFSKLWEGQGQVEPDIVLEFRMNGSQRLRGGVGA